MGNLLDRFIKYVKIDTTSIEEIGKIPSFEGERELAIVLEQELKEIGAEDVEVTEDCFVFATIPASEGYENIKPIGLLAHLDTAADCPGKDVKPILHKKYDGGVLTINDSVDINPEQYPEILRYIGEDIVTSDGTTLLGADDKAGIAIIMDAAEELMKNDSIKHGKVRIAFTPDEEVSVGGASIFDVEKFGAEIGVTVDGGGTGELSFETFNAYSYRVKIRGNNIHTAEAKGKLVNASTIAFEFDAMLPKFERPEYTEGYEGFIHLCEIKGDVEEAYMDYIIRDFEKEGIEAKKKMMVDVAKQLNEKYNQERVVLEGFMEYGNPRDEIVKHKNFIELIEEAYIASGVKPYNEPVRGGTDGSTLAEKGIACPNIFTAGFNFHSCREYVSVDGMQKSSNVIIELVKRFAIKENEKGKVNNEEKS
ncbi:MAG: peptidase T [Anaerovoracaceae bacterium]